MTNGNGNPYSSTRAQKSREEHNWMKQMHQILHRVNFSKDYIRFEFLCFFVIFLVRGYILILGRMLKIDNISWTSIINQMQKIYFWKSFRISLQKNKNAIKWGCIWIVIKNLFIETPLALRIQFWNWFETTLSEYFKLLCSWKENIKQCLKIL